MKKLVLLLLLAGMVPVTNVAAESQEDDEELVAGDYDADDDNLDEMSDTGSAE